MSSLKDLDLSIFRSEEFILAILRGAAYLIVGLIILRIVIVLVRRFVKGRVTAQIQMLITKSLNYLGIAVIAIIVLLELGVNLSPILGAAGIVGLAIGIASQASLSNVISGLFLISEKPFAVGDLIRSGDKLGFVISIDLLSIKIRSLDNLYIRIPNEKIINTEVTNVTRFPIRRMDFDLSVAYKDDLEKVRSILQEIARANSLVLDEPEPVIVFREFGDSGISILFGIWFQKADFLDVKNSIFLQIKKRFDEESIEIPFPHRTLYTGSATDPFPITHDVENINNES